MSIIALISAFFGFRGRLARSEWFTRLMIAALFCAAFGDLLDSFIGNLGSGLLALVFIGCAVSLATRRLHDVDRSGLALAIAIVPVFGPIWLLIQLLRPGVRHENRYGPDPTAHSDYFKVDIAR